MKTFCFLVSLFFLFMILFACRQKATKMIDDDFTLFDEAPVLIDHLILSESNFNIGLYHIPSNASSQEYIQIRRIYPDSSFKVIESYERFSNGRIYAVGDTGLQVILIDTSWREEKTIFDTISLSLKKLK